MATGHSLISIGGGSRACRHLLALGTLAALLQPTFARAEYRCREDKHVVGTCFSVHGRLMRYANSRLNLWPIGTDRLLGIQYPGDMPGVGGNFVDLPGELAVLEKEDLIFFGDFEVCPFSQQEPKIKQYACIDKATNLRKLTNDEWKKLQFNDTKR